MKTLNVSGPSTLTRRQFVKVNKNARANYMMPTRATF